MVSENRGKSADGSGEDVTLKDEVDSKTDHAEFAAIVWKITDDNRSHSNNDAMCSKRCIGNTYNLETSIDVLNFVELRWIFGSYEEEYHEVGYNDMNDNDGDLNAEGNYDHDDAPPVLDGNIISLFPSSP